MLDLNVSKDVVSIDPNQTLSQIANYLAQIQAIINTFSILISIVTALATVLGIGFTAFGFLAQGRAESQIEKLKHETKMEIDTRHAAHKEEVALLQAIMRAQSNEFLLEMQKKLQADLEEKIDYVQRMYSGEVIQKLQSVESAYASNLRKIEDILIAFQQECTQIDEVGAVKFDFPTYNTLRHLLTRVVSGIKADISGALGRITEEYADKVGITTAILLTELIYSLINSNHLGRPDQRMLASRLIDTLALKINS